MAHRYGYARREAIKAQKAAQDAKFLEDNADYIKQIVDTVKANSNIAAGRFAVVIRDSKTTLNEMIQSDVNAYVSDIMEGKEKPEDRLSFCGIQNIYDSRKEAQAHTPRAAGYEDNRYGWEGWKERTGVVQITSDSGKWGAKIYPSTAAIKKAAIKYAKTKKGFEYKFENIPLW